MTDEEKAEEYYYKAYPTTLSIGEEERKKKVLNIFLAGLKTGRETEKEYVKKNAFTSMKEQGLFPFGKWHKVAMVFITLQDTKNYSLVGLIKNIKKYVVLMLGKKLYSLGSEK